MAHITQRNAYERVELSVPSTGVRVSRRGSIVALNAFLVALAAVLLYAMFIGIDGWAHIAVLGGIATTTVGTMLAIHPFRG